MRSITVLGISVVLGLALGCGQQAKAPAADTTTAEVAQAPETTAPVTLEMVEVAAEGTVFDPPVEVVQIPEGAWYCDMGTVHYARLDEGDGKCAKCGMTLTHKLAAAAEPAEESMTDEDMGDHQGAEHQG